MAHRALSFAASMRVIVGVHDRTTDGGTDTEVSRLARLTDADDLVFEIADLADSGFTFERNKSHFARRHLQSGVCALFCHNLSGDTCRASYLSASAGLKLDRVNDGTYGDVHKAKAVARLDVRARALNDLVAYAQTYGSKDIGLDAVLICEERDVRGTVGIVLYGFNGSDHAVLIALEIYNSVFDSVAAADVTYGNFTLIVSSAGLALIVKQASFGLVAAELGISVYRHKTAGGRSRFKSFNSHFIPPYDNELKYSIALESAVSWTIAFL